MERVKNQVYQLLRWSEKYTKADMVYITKGSFWIIFGQVTSSLLSFGLILIFANLVSKEDYGLYRYILSMVGILNIFTLTGMNQAVMQAVANGKEDSLKNSVNYQLKWNTLMFTAATVLAVYYWWQGNLIIAISFLIIGFFSPLAAALNTYNAYLSGKRNFRAVGLFSLLSSIIYVGGMILAIYLGGDVIWLIIGYSLTSFVSNLVFYLATVRIYNLKTSAARETDREVLRYGRQLTFVDYMAPIVSQIDSIILHHFWGNTSLATYSLATAVPNRATVMFKSWLSVGFPKFAARTTKEINTVFFKRIIQGLTIGLLCTIAYIALSPLLFHYLIPKYLDSLFYSQLLSICFIVALPNRYISLLLTSQKMPRVIFINNLTQNILRIVLFVILGIWSGILGLVIAQVLYSFISLIANFTAWQIASR